VSRPKAYPLPLEVSRPEDVRAPARSDRGLNPLVEQGLEESPYSEESPREEVYEVTSPVSPSALPGRDPEQAQ
jgi:hypothetical protein